MNRPRANPFFSGLVASVVLTVVMVAVIISGIPAGPQIPLPWNQQVTLHVQLADADALAPHASVEVAGVKVGEVESVAAQGNLALVTLQIDSQYSDIHRDATIYLRAHGLFGPKYISILPGTSTSPQLHDGDTIAVNQTVQPVDLNAILQDLQAPEQQNLRTTIVELGKASAGQGDDFNHFLVAADSLTQVLDTPLKSIGAVGPQLSDMLVKNEAFNAYFAQTPLDQLVANNEQTIQAFAANADHLQSLLVHANSVFTQLNSALGGNTASAIQQVIQAVGDNSANGVIPKLTNFTYLLGLFGANLTGKDPTVKAAAQDATQGIISAIENVRSAFSGGDSCTGVAGNHCAVSSDGLEHYLHVRTFNFPPPILPAGTLPCLMLPPPAPAGCFTIPVAAYGQATGPSFAGQQLNGFGALFAS